MELKLILESLLFSAQKPLSVKELHDVLAAATEQEGADATAKSLAKTKDTELTLALEELAREHETAARSYRLACVAGSWQFVTQPEFGPWLRALVGVKSRPPRLSLPALETLAIIAYRQPITRAEIEQIRGVNVDATMQTLMERGLVEAVGRAEVVGHPPTYARPRCSSNTLACAVWKVCPPRTNSVASSSKKPSGPVTAEPGLATTPPEQLALQPAAPEPGEGGNEEAGSQKTGDIPKE